jgi:inner membrane protein
MDSITHVLLGASCAAVLAPVANRRAAMAIGAVLNTLPDLDVLVRYADPVANLTFHRSYSHSLLVLPWVALAVWALLLATWRPARAARGRWLAVCLVALLTHPLLDAFTVYGTQLWWPLESPPVMVSSLFIIDPAITVALLAGVIAAFRLRDPARARRWLVGGLAFSAAYLGWGVAAKADIEHGVRAQLAREGRRDAPVLTVPTPFNSILWRVVVMTPDGYREGFRRVFAGAADTRWSSHESDRGVLGAVRDAWAVRRLDWFTHGFWSVRVHADGLAIEDLRMGMEPDYIFRFIVAEHRDGALVPMQPSRQLPWPRLSSARLGEMWRRAAADGGER